MKTMLAALLVMTTAAHAQDAVPTEVTTLGTATVTLHLHGFLTAEELTVLRLVAKDTNALALFVPTGAGFAAMAACPDDGFIRGSAPVPGAVALSGQQDAETARTDALAACERAKQGQAACVIVLEVAPAQ